MTKKKDKKSAAKKAVKAPAKPKRVTAASIVRQYLGRKVVPTDEEIIDAVNKGTGRETFNKAQLAWYKTAWRKENGPINQPTARRQPEALARSQKGKKAEPVQEEDLIEA